MLDALAFEPPHSTPPSSTEGGTGAAEKTPRSAAGLATAGERLGRKSRVLLVDHEDRSVDFDAILYFVDCHDYVH